MTLDPSKRRKLEGIMKDQWLKMGQEELGPYSELTCVDIDPR